MQYELIRKTCRAVISWDWHFFSASFLSFCCLVYFLQINEDALNLKIHNWLMSVENTNAKCIQKHFSKRETENENSCLFPEKMFHSSNSLLVLIHLNIDIRPRCAILIIITLLHFLVVCMNVWHAFHNYQRIYTQFIPS